MVPVSLHSFLGDCLASICPNLMSFFSFPGSSLPYPLYPSISPIPGPIALLARPSPNFFPAVAVLAVSGRSTIHYTRQFFDYF